MLYFLNVFWIQHRDQFFPISGHGFHILIQLHPVKAAMLGIWIDSNDRPCEPAFALPKFGIEKNLHPVADFELLCHMISFAAARPKYETDASRDENTAIDRPLRVTFHETAGQNANSLKEENTTCKDEHYTKDMEKNFHENFLYWSGNVAMIILSENIKLGASTRRCWERD